MKDNMKVYRIGFNGNDETEFEIQPGTAEAEMCELMELFCCFIQESDIQIITVDYIEIVQ